MTSRSRRTLSGAAQYIAADENQVERGGRKFAAVQDEAARDTLLLILAEIRATNAYLAEIVGDAVRPQDTEK